jgi:hypothetical protein
VIMMNVMMRMMMMYYETQVSRHANGIGMATSHL